MRRWFSIAKATALEMLSEPLSLLLLLSALALTVFAPAFHYHQFGEASRMSRDAGFSAIFLAGSAFSIFVTIRAFRREIESGTLAMALSHPIARGGFFLAKLLGACFAYLLFVIIVLCACMVMIIGAEIGGIIADRSGDIARIYGPFFAIGVGLIILPLIIAAFFNSFFRFRFILSAIITMLILAILSSMIAIYMAPMMILALLPVAVLLMIPAIILMGVSGAFAMRFRANGAATIAGISFVLMLPMIGCYYLPDALTNGGEVAWSYVGLATLVAIPAFIAVTLIGINFISERDVP